MDSRLVDEINDVANTADLEDLLLSLASKGFEKARAGVGKVDLEVSSWYDTQENVLLVRFGTTFKGQTCITIAIDAGTGGVDGIGEQVLCMMRLVDAFDDYAKDSIIRVISDPDGVDTRGHDGCGGHDR